MNAHLPTAIDPVAAPASPVLIAGDSVRVAGIRPFREEDRIQVVSLLSGLPDIYPGADEWLARRLGEVAAGHAFCDVAESVRGELIGLTIEVPKSVGWKLCTIYVEESSRRAGVARALIENAAHRWAEYRVMRNHLTVRESRLAPVAALLRPFGFELHTVQQNRYGAGRHEAVLIRG